MAISRSLPQEDRMEGAPLSWPSTGTLRVDDPPQLLPMFLQKKGEALVPHSQPCPGTPEHRALA